MSMPSLDPLLGLALIGNDLALSSSAKLRSDIYTACPNQDRYMLSGYAVICDIHLEHGVFAKVVRAMREYGWSGIQAHAEDAAQAVAASGGMRIVEGEIFRSNSLTDSIGSADVFFMDGDVYYTVIVSREFREFHPRGPVEPQDFMYLISSSSRRASMSESRTLEAGIVSQGESEIRNKLAAFTEAIQKAAEKVVGHETVEAFPFSWIPREVPHSRMADLRRRFAKENIQVNVIPAVIENTRAGAAEILSVKGHRSLLLELKEAGFARESDVLARRGAKEEETKASLEVLKFSELVKSEFLLQCRKSSSLLVRVASRKEIEEAPVAGLVCASCSRTFKDELVSQGLSVSDLGKEMSDGSHWMTVWVSARLVEAGIPLDAIYWNLEESGDEIDIMVDFMGELWLIELKDREFGAGDAHPFNYRTVRYASSKSFIISTDKVSPDAKRVFAELSRPNRSSASSQPVYIEGLDNVASYFQKEVNRASSWQANSYLNLPKLLTGFDLTKVLG